MGNTDSVILYGKTPKASITDRGDRISGAFSLRYFRAFESRFWKRWVSGTGIAEHFGKLRDCEHGTGLFDGRRQVLANILDHLVGIDQHGGIHRRLTGLRVGQKIANQHLHTVRALYAVGKIAESFGVELRAVFLLQELAVDGHLPQWLL